jgi:hypothetical protein
MEGGCRYHGENVINVHVIPPLVADILPSSRRRRPNEIPLNPPLVNIMIILLRPQHPRKRLTLHIPHIIRQRNITQLPVKRIRLGLASRNHIIKRFFVERAVAADLGGQFEANNGGLARGDVLEVVPGSAFGADVGGVGGVDAASDDAFVKGVFDVGGDVLSAPQFGKVGFVLREEHLPS